MGWTSGTENCAEGHNGTFLGCLTYPLGTDKWMDRWDSGKSLCHWKKGCPTFPVDSRWQCWTCVESMMMKWRHYSSIIGTLPKSPQNSDVCVRESKSGATLGSNFDGTY